MPRRLLSDPAREGSLSTAPSLDAPLLVVMHAQGFIERSPKGGSESLSSRFGSEPTAFKRSPVGPSLYSRYTKILLRH
jgi:hypothetical protein